MILWHFKLELVWSYITKVNSIILVCNMILYSNILSTEQQSGVCTISPYAVAIYLFCKQTQLFMTQPILHIWLPHKRKQGFYKASKHTQQKHTHKASIFSSCFYKWNTSSLWITKDSVQCAISASTMGTKWERNT